MLCACSVSSGLSLKSEGVIEIQVFSRAMHLRSLRCAKKQPYPRLTGNSFVFLNFDQETFSGFAGKNLDSQK